VRKEDTYGGRESAFLPCGSLICCLMRIACCFSTGKVTHQNATLFRVEHITIIELVKF
jgi:hypothetical protein